MHKKYARDGVVVMTVSVDDVDSKDGALAFLKKVKATTRNYLLKEEPEFWQKKWQITAPPALFIFDRDGKRAAKFDSDDSEKKYNHEEIEKSLVELLRAKP
jgi:hypothetical protein